MNKIFLTIAIFFSFIGYSQTVKDVSIQLQAQIVNSDIKVTWESTGGGSIYRKELSIDSDWVLLKSNIPSSQQEYLDNSVEVNLTNPDGSQLNMGNNIILASITSCDDDEKNIPYASGTSFTQHLTTQMNTYRLTEDEETITDFLIGSIDDSGYIRRDLIDILADLAVTQNIFTIT